MDFENQNSVNSKFKLISLKVKGIRRCYQIFRNFVWLEATCTMVQRVASILCTSEKPYKKGLAFKGCRSVLNDSRSGKKIICCCQFAFQEFIETRWHECCNLLCFHNASWLCHEM